MSKFNPIKAKQEADKQEKAGRLEQAIKLYRQIVDDNPRDWNTTNKIGDLLAKLGRTRDAAKEYAKVADFYAKDGFLLKAIAIWKKINKLDTTSLDPYLNLAELYAKQGLMMEAKGQFQIVVDEHLKRGRGRDAADVLKKIVDIDPGDLKVRSKLADLYTRDGNKPKAVEEYVAIAEELNKKGHLAEALQVLEKGLKLDPSSARLRDELARIHLLQKNYDKAARYLQEAVRASPGDSQLLSRLGEAYLGGHKIDEAEAIFRKLLEANPEDQDARIQMGRVHLLRGQVDRAYDELLPAVDALLSRREGEKAAAIMQQLAQKNPAHVRTLNKLVEIHRLFQNDRAVVATYTQLSEAYISHGQFEEAAAVLEILVTMEPHNQQHRSKLDFVRAKAHPAQRSAGAAAPVTAPDDFEVEDLGFPLTEEPALPAVATPRAAPAPPPPAAPPGAAPPAVAPAPSPRSAPAIELSGPLGEEDTEFIEEHLAEGRVFRKYGLVDKAIDQFEAVIARFPDHVETRLELKDLYQEREEPVKVAEQCMALAQISRLNGDAEGARAHEDEARELAPGLVPEAAPSIQEEPELAGEELAPGITVEEEIPLEEPMSIDLGEAGLDDLPPPAGGQAPVAEESLDLNLELEPPEPAEPEGAEVALSESPFDGGFGSLLADVVSPPEPAPMSEPVPLSPKAPPPAPSALAGAPRELQRLIEEVDSYVSLGFVDDAKETLRSARARFKDHPALLEKIAEMGLDQESAAPMVSSDDVLGDLGLPEIPEPARSAETDFGSPGLADLALPEPDLLEMPLPEPPAPEPDVLEAELFGGPAPAAPENNPLEEDLFGAPTPPGPDLGEPDLGEPDLGGPDLGEPDLGGPDLGGPDLGGLDDGDGVDLGVELGELFGAQSAVEEPPLIESGSSLEDSGLSEILREFQRGVDKQLGQEDYDTRYNLGIAYKEMGLVDEAIAEFQLAAKDETRVLECSSMLGICFLEKGMPKLAVKWFEKGLNVPGRTQEEYLGLRYDLATAFEADGDTERALGLFTELYGQHASFRDVAAKVRELRAAHG